MSTAALSRPIPAHLVSPGAVAGEDPHPALVSGEVAQGVQTQGALAQRPAALVLGVRYLEIGVHVGQVPIEERRLR